MASERVIKPDFLIVGTMKSGTSTLADYLSMHPALHVAPNEVHYFDREDNYARGPEWYASQLVRGCPPERRADVLHGEKTPTYSYLPTCLPRIHALVPEARLVWIFRDPVKRAFSNYLHRRKKGEDLATFEEAVANEASRVNESLYFGYLERSRYAEQVERFLEVYPFERMHFLLFEDLVRAPLDELNRLASFLGVGPFPEPLGEVHSNTTRMPLWGGSLALVGRTLGFDSWPYKFTRTLNNVITRPNPKFPMHLRAELVERMRPDNDRLAALTGLDLSPWYRDA